MSYIFICLLIICATSQTTGDANHSSLELDIKYGSHALHALQRLLNFFESDAQNINLDGLYGLRIAQGQLIALDRHLTSSDDQTHSNNELIHTLSQQIERIANVSLNQIQREASFYLHRFALIANQPFVIEYQGQQLHQHLMENGERDSSFDEEQSDRCFAELLGSSERLNSRKCSISSSCWDMMTSPMTKDYRLTHQLLWFLVAKNIGCISKTLANKKLHSFEGYFCANIYQDAQYNLLNNINQDLFLEQLLLCSIIGYKDFLRIDWFHTVLSWQHPDYACFSDASETIRFRGRHLLFEQEMNDGCLSHKSGLAAGLLATYSRVFCNKTFVEFSLSLSIGSMIKLGGARSFIRDHVEKFITLVSCKTNEQLMRMLKQLLDERDILWRENEYLKAKLNQSILMETIEELKNERDLLYHLLANLTSKKKKNEPFKHQNNANLLSSPSIDYRHYSTPSRHHHQQPSSAVNYLRTHRLKTIDESQATTTYRPETSSTIPMKPPSTNKQMFVHPLTSEWHKPIRKHDSRLKHSQNSPFQHYRSQSLQDLT